jgi:putative nucleotidyltransferase with HDIG domain
MPRTSVRQKRLRPHSRETEAAAVARARRAQMTTDPVGLERVVGGKVSALSGALTRIGAGRGAILDVFWAALKCRDGETVRHCERVACYTVGLAEAMGCSRREVKQIERGAYLHDLGKIGVPDAILLKPGPLTRDEWVIMQSHAEKGYQMLRVIPFLEEVAELVYSHEERYDGRGYPRRLKGETIPLGARIVAVADTLDAMISDRPYRPALPFEEAAEEIVRSSGTQFDPKVVEAFQRVFLPLERVFGDRRERCGHPASACSSTPSRGGSPGPSRRWPGEQGGGEAGLLSGAVGDTGASGRSAGPARGGPCGPGRLLREPVTGGSSQRPGPSRRTAGRRPPARLSAPPPRR